MLVSKSFPCHWCVCPGRSEVGSCFCACPEKVFHVRQNHGEISWESDWGPAKEGDGWRMTYEERGGQEKLFPFSLHREHPGTVALRAVTVFLGLIGGEMPPRGPWGSLGSREGAAQHFLIHPEPHRQEHPALTSGPAGLQSQGQRALSVQSQWRQSWTEAPELQILNVLTWLLSGGQEHLVPERCFSWPEITLFSVC